MLQWLRRRGSTRVVDRERRGGGMNLAMIQREYAGAWVALKGDQVVDARPTPYELVAALHSRGIKNTTIIRVPGLDEAELVGLG
jgi:hypothetical protein